MAEKITGEQLRDDIDAGRTGDKVAFPDPAAAPLETDAEAGGVSTRFPSERRDVAHDPGDRWGGMALYIGMIVALALVVAAIWLAT
ncbi:hypothetical protein O9Z70_10995 [Devosia sp. YIM 151766]|uniref:hypothetical protein n=1 Tax=Devosia sp. YIM 151766 TaxID=3017325 RepID=UPI00255C5238|nr:hypothetical protein [Devosia sp. YIM 151766]WIY52006.1 hypothetical protein O9Z70_10995 [Devosia sp. YIM 151766]